MVSAPLDYGLVAYSTVSNPPGGLAGVPDFIVPPASTPAQAEGFLYQQQAGEELLEAENRRLQEHLRQVHQLQYVQTQQNMRGFRQNYLDPLLIQQQLQWLAVML